MANHTGSSRHRRPGAVAELVSVVPAPARRWTLHRRARRAPFTCSRREPRTRCRARCTHGATARWSASFTAASVGYAQFGVYPLAGAGGVPPTARRPATDRTFLPYWPGERRREAAAAERGVDLAAHRHAAAGRVRGDAGYELAGRQPRRRGQARHAARRRPAVGGAGRPDLGGRPGAAVRRERDDAAVLRRRQRRLLRQAIRAAERRGRAMAVAAAGFDRDRAELLHPVRRRGRRRAQPGRASTQITRTAYHLGETVAGQILPGTFGNTDGGRCGAAWPADGAANAGVLTSLASDGGVTTVVLNSGELPSSDGPYDNALAATTSRRRHHHGGAARRLGDHQPARVGVGELVGQARSSTRRRTSSRRPR